jgi:cation:H+ antiporter
MSLLTVALFIISYGIRGQGRITRPGGAVLLAGYFAYTAFLIVNAFG